jgi:hypothetical protein
MCVLWRRKNTQSLGAHSKYRPLDVRDMCHIIEYPEFQLSGKIMRQIYFGSEKAKVLKPEENLGHSSSRIGGSWDPYPFQHFGV